MVALVLVALLAAPAWLLAAVAPELPDPGTVPGVTKQQQERAGLQASGEVYKQMPVLPDSNPVTQYVQRLGQRLQAVIPTEYSWPYQFHVVPQKEINAFALPGGPIFVNLGTINAADNEAELVGVMAHEMSHIYMQHSMKAARSRSTPSALAGLLGGILGAYGGPIGSLASLGVQIGAGAVLMKYSRQDEAQADAVGAIIMYKAGYNPQAMADFFRKLEQQGGGSGGPQFLSDHPNPGNREAAIQKEIADWPPEQWRGDSSQFRQAKSAAQAITAYTAQQIAQGAKQGIWARQNSQGGAAPAARQVTSTDDIAAPLAVTASNNLVRLQHTGYRIAYPDNWQVVGNTQSPVTIAPQGGLVQSAVACGVLIDQYRPRSPNQPLDEITNELIGTLQQQDPHLRVIGAPQSITVNGVSGRSVDLAGVSPVQRDGQPERERDWLVTVPRPDGTLAYLVFVSPESAFPSLRPTFESMLRTFHLE